MKKLLVVASLCAATLALAQRVDSYDYCVQPAVNRTVTISDLPDGGAILTQVCAALPTVNGTTSLGGCDNMQRELKGANRTAVLNILDKAGQLWGVRQGASCADGGTPDAGL